MARPPALYARSERNLAIRFLTTFAYCYGRFYHRLKVRSPCQLPKTGPAILVCNHISGLDPFLVQAASPRLIRWMMAREYYDLLPFRWVYQTAGMIPVDRGGRDLAATRAALQALEAGYVLGVFPEGKIETDNELLPFQPGIALLALKSGASVYPAYLQGTQRGREIVAANLIPARASLNFGPPVAFTQPEGGRRDFDQTTAEIREKVETLRQTELERRKNQH